MRKSLWVLFCALSVFGMVACEADDGTDSDAGTADVSTDTGTDLGGTGPVCSVDDTTAFEASCLSTFFSCYDADGACSVMEDIDFPGFAAGDEISWSNGAKWSTGFDVVTQNLSVTVTPASGGLCATATGMAMGTDGYQATFTLADDQTQTLTLEIDGSGNMAVTCADNTTETFTASERQALMECLGARCDSREFPEL